MSAVGDAGRWNRAPDGKRLEKLSPVKQRLMTTMEVDKKVEALLAWARGGVRPAGLQKVPTTRVSLRKWADPAGEFRSWADPTIDSPRGRNAALVKTFFEVVTQLQAVEEGEPATEADEKAELKARNESLLRQSAKQQEELRKLANELALARSLARQS